MKILYNNNIYTFDSTDSNAECINLTIDMGKTSVGIPIASRLWITDTKDDIHQIICQWYPDGSENIVTAELSDDCWHDHAKETIHGTKIVEVMCEDSDTMPIDNTLQLSTEDESLSTFQAINILLTTSIDDVGTSHQRTLLLCGENSNVIYAKIVFIGETISEDDDIAAMANLQGYHIAPEDSYVFYEADPYEPVYSSELLNRKRKEYLLCIDRLKDKIGSQEGLLDVIKFFGYKDMYIGTLWKVTNEDSPYYKGYSIRYTDADGNKNTLDDYDVQYKQVNRAILVYKIVKTSNEDYDIIPKTATVNSYGMDGNSIKLARLREVINEQFMPAAIPIREILGECDVYYAAACGTSAADNLNEYDYSEHNIKLSLAKEDVYEFRLSRYYALANQIFQEDYIKKVSNAEKDCLPDTFKGCLLYRLKRVQTIYEFLKDKKELVHDDIVVWKGEDDEHDIKVSYFVYLLTTPKTDDIPNFIADTYSCIHSEAVTIMMYLYEACEYLSDKLHQDALEFPDYLWTVWQETAFLTAQPIERTDEYKYTHDMYQVLTNRYCGCVSLSLCCQDAFHYTWNDIHSWWDHTSHFNSDTKTVSNFKDGITWANEASITKVEWTLYLHDNHDIKYEYVCEKSDSTKSIPHMKDGVADYDIYGVPVVASLFVYHNGLYDVEAIIYDAFGHRDRLYKENAINVHPSKCYLTGIAQNVVRPVDTHIEDEIESTHDENSINAFCNSFLYGPLKYNRSFGKANGLLFKTPFFPKIVSKDTAYYLYPFTISNAVDANERYDHTNDKDIEASSPFSLPNIIPSQPTALIFPLKSIGVVEAPEDIDQDDEEQLRQYVLNQSSSMSYEITTNDIKLWNTGDTVHANCLIVTKGTNLYKYVLPENGNNTYDGSKIISDLESIDFFNQYKWQFTYMPNKHDSPILIGIAKTLTTDTDVDNIYLANTSYTEYIDTSKDSNPLDYSISFVANKYSAELRNSDADDDTVITLSDVTYPDIMSKIQSLYKDSNKMYYVSSIDKSVNSNDTSVPKIQGLMYNAFIGMPHFGTWTWIAGGYAKLKKFSWLVVSIDNNNIPAKHNIIWDIERRNILKDSKTFNSTTEVTWSSYLSDASYELFNNISRKDAQDNKLANTGFPVAYFPYMFTEIGQYRISCKFQDMNGDTYTVPYVIVDVE